MLVKKFVMMMPLSPERMTEIRWCRSKNLFATPRSMLSVCLQLCEMVFAVQGSLGLQGLFLFSSLSVFPVSGLTMSSSRLRPPLKKKQRVLAAMFVSE